MKRRIANLRLLAVVLALTFLSIGTPVVGELVVAGSGLGMFNPATGDFFSDMRASLSSAFPGTTFEDVPDLTQDLTGFDLVVLTVIGNTISDDEGTSIFNYVSAGGNILYVGEGGESYGDANDPLTQPFGVFMTRDLATEGGITYADYTNLAHPFLTGPFGAPLLPASGADAAQISTLGPSVEIARWGNGGGVAVSAIDRDTITPGSGFAIFTTDLDMMTGWYADDFGPVLNNALAVSTPVPEPSTLASLGGLLGVGLIGGWWRRRGK